MKPQKLYKTFVKLDTVAKRMGINPKEQRLIMAADPLWIHMVLDYIKKKYGSVNNYLVKKGSMDPDSIQKIKEILLCE